MVSLPVYPDFRHIHQAPAYLRGAVHGPVVVLCADETGALHAADGAATAYAYDDWLGVRRVAAPSQPQAADELEDLYESVW